MRRSSLRTVRASLLVALLLPLLAVLTAWVVLPLGARAAPGTDQLQSQIDNRRARESSLRADAATFGRLEAKFAADVAVIQGRLDEVQGELDRRLAALARTRGQLAGQRRRHAGLVIRLDSSKTVLARRLVEIYQAGEPDLASYVLGAASFADLLERADFLTRVSRQDNRVIKLVIGARNAARASAIRLRKLAGRQRTTAAAVQRQRDALSSMRDGLAAKEASFAQAKRARLAALRATRSGRKRLQGQLDDLLAQQRQAFSTSGPATSGGPWTIPWSVVQCESGGQNMPPNWAAASGYYQIIPSTWALFGGSGPAAYLAPKSEQDRVAAAIWNGGAGAQNWDCWKLLNGIPLG
jgi:peptidoglycan hydrolase CwlO-like protein